MSDERRIKEGDFIRLNFTGRIKESGEVFDTTVEDEAKKAGIYDNNYSYKPIIVQVGKGQLVKGLDRELVGKTIGEYTIELKPEDAFGFRSAKLLRLMPRGVFKKHNIDPIPGLRVNIDGVLATIVSTTGNRILVDYNHPLAGKEVVYEVEILGFVDDNVERTRAMIDYYLGINDPEIVSVKEEGDNIKVVIKPKTKGENKEGVIQVLKEEVEKLKKDFEESLGKKVEFVIE